MRSSGVQLGAEAVSDLVQRRFNLLSVDDHDDVKAKAGGNRLRRARARRHGEHRRLEALAEAAVSLGEAALYRRLCAASN